MSKAIRFVPMVSIHPGIEFVELPETGMRGARARRSLAADTELIRVPSCDCIRLSDARQCEFCRPFDALSDVVVMTLHLWHLRQMPTGRSHRAYLDRLPSDFNHPVLWQDWHDFQGSPIVDLLERRRHGMIEELNEALQIRPDLSLEAEEYVFHQALVGSRALMVAKPTFELNLVPYVDLLNHAGPGANAKWNFRDGAFHVRLRHPVAAGQEITLNYGRKSNTTLMIDYGFQLPDNPYNTCELETLTLHHHTGSDAFRSDWTKLREQQSHSADRDPVEVEWSCLQRVRDEIEVCLAQRYRSTLEEDLAALQREREPRCREALRYLASEKELIRKWSRLIDEVETCIASPGSASQTAAAWDPDVDVFLTYAKEFWAPRFG